MKKLFVSACIIATLFFVACSGNDTKAYDESLPATTSTKPVTPLTINDTLLSDTGSVRPAAQVTMPSAITSNTTTLSGNTSTAKAGLNPAHGQPGHRCDIAVGASLSTPVAASTPQVKSMTSNTTTPSAQISSPSTSPISTPSALSSGSGKLNPPHGQPGHDCAVEVGKPLKN